MSEQVAIDFSSLDTDGGSPPGWVWATLVDLVAPEPNAMTDGPFGSKLKSAHYVDAGVRVVRLGNLGVGEFKHGDRSFVSPEHAATLTRHAVEAGDLLIAALAEPVGRACQVPASILPAIIKADCIRYKPHPGLSPKFVMHWLNSPQGAKNAEAHSHGVGRLRINMKNMRGLAVPVAPLPEQQRIVAEIEKQFTRLDAAVANLERVKANLKRARASVLKAAAEGQLVPTEAELARAEGRDYEPASVLLERALEERGRKHEETQEGAKRKKKYKPPVEPDTEGLPELPEGWIWGTMDSFLTDIQAGKSFRCDPSKPTGDQVGIVKVSAVTWGTYDEEEAKTVDDPEKVNPEYVIEEGDFLFSRANTIELVGACVIVGGVTRTTILSDKILRLRTTNPAWDRWLLWVLRSLHGREQIESLATGNQDSMRNIGQARIRQIAVPVPPPEELARIVREIESRQSVFDALDKSLSLNLVRCSRLRQSILKRAFEGKLVPQDPGDEPASELLARIQAEAEAAKPFKKKPTRKKAAKKKATRKKKTTT